VPKHTTIVSIYEVPASYVTGGVAPTISGVFKLSITDGDSKLNGTAGADPGSPQVMTVNGAPVQSYHFYWNDTISINGGAQTIKTFQLDIGGTTRSFVMNDTGTNIPGATTGTSFNLTDYNNYTPIKYKALLCFVAGTRIETDKGNRPVEKIRIGDLVFTKDHGLQPVRWAGHVKLSNRDLLARPHLHPVLIPASSFGLNLPRRDLFVSPQHRVLLNGWQVELNFGIDEVLAPAKALVGRNGIRVDADRHEVSYYHIMFDRHEVIYSESLATESFLVGDTIQEGMDQELLAEILELFPELDTDQSVERNAPARPILRRFEVNTLETFAA